MSEDGVGTPGTGSFRKKSGEGRELRDPEEERGRVALPHGT